jgi:hypothetical protein
MSLREDMEWLNKTGLLREGRGMCYAVTISDVRTVWGKTQLFVTPIAGEGSAWVDADSMYELVGTEV